MLEKIFEKIHEGAFARPSIHRLWEKLPERAPLETVAELYGTPALITHRDSTAVVYANSAAKDLLGDSLVGLSVDSAAPAGRLRWHSEGGAKELSFRAQKMLNVKRGLGEFRFLELGNLAG